MEKRQSQAERQSPKQLRYIREKDTTTEMTIMSGLRRPFSAITSSRRRSSRSSSGGSSGGSSPTGQRQWRGLSVQFLARTWDKVQSGALAQDVALVETREALGKHVPQGATLQLVGSAGGERYHGRAECGEMVEFEASQVRNKPRSAWTLADVSAFVMQASDNTAPYVDHVESKHVGKQFQGAFVTCSRDSSFGDLVAALKDRYAGSNLRKVFVWLDAFGLAQAAPTRRSSDPTASYGELCLKDMFRAQARFQERLVFLDSWHSATPLGKVWCLLELCGASADEGATEALLSREGRDELLESLADEQGRADLLAVASAANIRHADCSDDQLLLQILEDQLGGADRVNATLRTAMRSLLAQSAKAAMQPLREQARGAPQDLAAAEQLAGKLLGAGLLLGQLGQTGIAGKYLHQSLSLFEGLGPDFVQDVLAARKAADAVLSGLTKMTSPSRKGAKQSAARREVDEVEALASESRASRWERSFLAESEALELEWDELEWLSDDEDDAM